MKLAALITALAMPTLAAATPSAEGVLLPYREVTVGYAVQGIIASMNAREGDLVSADALLATLIDSVETSEVDRFAKVLEQKEFAAQGAQNLYRDKVVSEGEAIEKRIERDIAKLQHQIALDLLERRKLRSPINGVVVEQMKEAGESVDINEAVFHIVDISRVYLQVFIEATAALKLTPGQTVSVRFPDYDTKAHAGLVDFIDPRIDGASGLVRIKILIENPNRKFIAGMRGTVDFSSPPPALATP